MVTTSRFHILGAGAIGCLLAHHLRQANYPVTLLLRNSESLLRFGSANSITITPTFSKQSGVQPIKTKGVEAEIVDSKETLSKIEHLIVTTKTYDTSLALSKVKERLTSNSTVTFLQNGMGVYEEILNKFYGKADQSEIPKFILGTTTHGCFRTEPFQVTHAGFGRLLLGAVDPAQRNTSQVQQTMKAFSQLDLEVQADQPFEVLRAKLLEKLVVNACINPLTATLGCKNGILLENEHSINLLKDTCYEASQIIQAEVGKTVTNLSYENLEKSVFEVCNATLDNKSSMLQDVSAKRKSEIDYINGYLVRLADSHNLPSPINRMWTQLIKAKTK
ncbi:2-dehydropantoate 2-reductase (Ketopantoate reductase) (KPA reductase) (KPR) [Basidiobolus ranarum]|uniref:2-dehydropantoate 2-reductase n=1 Tax=Basidiobolus ranarum TaxID=34480 RepID=A0ABR2WKZ2_9FUNG